MVIGAFPGQFKRHHLNPPKSLGIAERLSISIQHKLQLLYRPQIVEQFV